MRILVTGGTGFLGRHAAFRLKSEGHEVAILGRNEKIGRALAQRGILFHKADLDDAAAVIKACEKQEAIIHSGGLASPWGRYADFHNANVLGTRHVIEGCRRHGVKRLVHVSTPSLYFDYRDRLNIKESDPLPKPVTAYAATKGLADEAVDAAFRAGLPAIGIRPRAIFGPGDQAVLARVLRAAKKGVVPLVGGGNSYVDLTYVDNCVDALLLCLRAPESALGQNYNITNGEPVRVREMMELLFTALGRQVRYRTIPYPLGMTLATLLETKAKVFGGGEPKLTRYGVGLMAKSQTLDISLARRVLGYSPKVSLADGMKRFAEWLRIKDASGTDELARLGI